MTGTTVEILPVDGMCDYLPNHVLSQVLQQSFEAVGAPEFDEKDRQIARSFQQDYPVDEVKAKVRAYWRQIRRRVCVDVFRKTLAGCSISIAVPIYAVVWFHRRGDASYVVPTAWLNAACYAIGTPGHSWQLAAQVGQQLGMLAAARAMAHAAVTVMEEPSCWKKRRKNIKTTGGAYVCGAG